MTRGRFQLLLVLIVLVVGTASFAIALRLIDDDAPAGDVTTTTTTASTTTSTTAPSGLTTPTFVVVVSSESDEGGAALIRDELVEGGFEAGVLHSDDYASLEPGFFVAYVGPFPDVAAAEAAKAELVAAGYGASYSRCVGTAEECA